MPTAPAAALSPTAVLLSNGCYVDLARPQALPLPVIAHALAHLCRFTGHTLSFYSVAQHCLVVADVLSEAPWGTQYRSLLRAALLHDAAEALLGDVSSPLKGLLGSTYAALERSWNRAIAEGLGVDPDLLAHPLIKRADLTALAMERRDLMAETATPWPVLDGIGPRDWTINAVRPEDACLRFMERAILLGLPA